MKIAFVGVPSLHVYRALQSSTKATNGELTLSIIQIWKPALRNASWIGLLSLAWQITYFAVLHLKTLCLYLLSARQTKLFVTYEVNRDPRVIKALREADVSTILVYGGKILKKDVIDCNSALWLNLHGGILPEYRGLDSCYWACAQGNFHLVGVTVHMVEAKVDSGSIVLKVLAAPKPNWTILRLRKSIRAAEIRSIHALFSTRALADAPHLIDASKSNYFSSFPVRPKPWMRLSKLSHYVAI